jgi:hypothetical protein
MGTLLDPPTARQLQYATFLEIAVPSDATRGDVAKLIDHRIEQIIEWVNGANDGTFNRILFRIGQERLVDWAGRRIYRQPELLDVLTRAMDLEKAEFERECSMIREPEAELPK